MHSASRTRSILLDGRGLTDLRKVSWQSVVFECAKLGGVFMPHDVSCMCFSCFCFDVLCLEHLRLVFSMAALQAQSKCQGKMWIQEGMCLHPKGSFSGTGRSW